MLAFTNASTILTRTSRTPRTSTACSPGLTASTDVRLRPWKYERASTAVGGASARRAASGRSASARGEGRSRRGRASARHRRDAAASALRVPGPQTAFRALHARDGRADLRHAARLPHVVRARRRERRPRPHHRARYAWAGPSTRSACSTSARRRPAALLGNMGRPGGGIMALRGHASIQGSTDIPTLFDLLPGYLPMPHAGGNDDLDTYIAAETVDSGSGPTRRDYLVSLLKAWWGDAATADNDFCYGYLPRLTGSHSTYETVLEQLNGRCSGYFLYGQNPAVGSANARMQRLGMANLDWLVVRDLSLIESATWWKDGPEIETGELRTEDIKTEVFFLPPPRTQRRTAASPTPSGCCSGTTRRSSTLCRQLRSKPSPELIEELRSLRQSPSARPPCGATATSAGPRRSSRPSRCGPRPAARTPWSRCPRRASPPRPSPAPSFQKPAVSISLKSRTTSHSRLRHALRCSFPSPTPPPGSLRGRSTPPPCRRAVERGLIRAVIAAEPRQPVEAEVVVRRRRLSEPGLQEAHRIGPEVPVPLVASL